MNKLEPITNRSEALRFDDESSTAVTSQSKVSQEYRDITAADNARQINGDIYGDTHFGDNIHYSSKLFSWSLAHYGTPYQQQ
jgi:hypothetical protein